MSSAALSLQADERTVVGKQVKTLRRNGLIPAVIYEKGVESQMVSIDSIQLTKIWNKAGKHHAITLTVGTKQRLTIIKDADFDPVKGSLKHVAFHAIKMNEKIETEVPLHLEGQAPASVLGMLIHANTDHVVVKALPADLPDMLVVDVTVLQTAEDNIHAGQIKLPKNIELVSDPDQVVVSVVIPRAEVEKAEEEVAADEVPSAHGAADAATETAK
jgi:large subunit ribosomal protein L25